MILRCALAATLILSLTACDEDKKGRSTQSDGTAPDAASDQDKTSDAVEALKGCAISAAPEGNGVVIQCGDQPPVTVLNGTSGKDGKDGKDGINGKDGAAGKDGASCAVTPTEQGAEIKCGDLPPVIVQHGATGATGAQGEQGIQGDPGKDGIGCVVTPTEAGAIVSCGDSEEAVAIFHGLNGQDGKDGENGTNGTNGTNGQDGKDAEGLGIKAVIDPCGAYEGFDEIILQLTDGTLIAYFEHGNQRFLSTLSPGLYQTTDGQKCLITVKADGTVTW